MNPLPVPYFYTLFRYTHTRVGFLGVAKTARINSFVLFCFPQQSMANESFSGNWEGNILGENSVEVKSGTNFVKGWICAQLIIISFLALWMAFHIGIL